MGNFLTNLQSNFIANNIETKLDKVNDALEIKVNDCIVTVTDQFENGSAFISIYKEETGQNKRMRETYSYQDIKIDQVSRYNIYEIADVINMYAKTRKTNFKNLDSTISFREAQKLLEL